MLSSLPRVPLGTLAVGVPDCPETMLAHIASRVKMKVWYEAMSSRTRVMLNRNEKAVAEVLYFKFRGPSATWQKTSHPVGGDRRV
jgi:hypothetical protein